MLKARQLFVKQGMLMMIISVTLFYISACFSAFASPVEAPEPRMRPQLGMDRVLFTGLPLNENGLKNQSLQKDMPDGSIISVATHDVQPAPILGIAGPEYAIWSAAGFENPVKFSMYSNYLAFIDRWELSLYRAGDHALANPLKEFSGRGEEFLQAIEWDGSKNGKAILRPGEKVAYVLRVYDSSRNNDHTESQTFTISRSFSKKQRLKMAKTAAAKAAMLLNSAKPIKRSIPVIGGLLELTISNMSKYTELDINRLKVMSDQNGVINLKQIVPVGDYALKIMSGNATGHMNVSVSGNQSLFLDMISLAGIDDLVVTPKTDNKKVASDIGILNVTATVLGKDLLAHVRSSGSWSAAATSILSRIDPSKEYRILSPVEGQSRKFLELDYSSEYVAWPKKPILNPEEIEIYSGEADFELSRSMEGALQLPHTDIDPQSSNVWITTAGQDDVMLSLDKDYVFSASQGQILITMQGKAKLSKLPKYARKLARLYVSYDAHGAGNNGLSSVAKLIGEEPVKQAVTKKETAIPMLPAAADVPKATDVLYDEAYDNLGALWRKHRDDENGLSTPKKEPLDWETITKNGTSSDDMTFAPGGVLESDEEIKNSDFSIRSSTGDLLLFRKPSKLAE